MKAVILLLMIGIASAAPVMTTMTKSAGALEKAVDAAEDIIGAISGFVSTLLAAKGTIESAALIDYYDVDAYETSATMSDHDKEANALIESAWAKAKKAKDAKHGATRKCKHLPSYSECYEEVVEMQENAAQANSLALAATKRALSLVRMDLEELELLGAGWSYYRGPEHDNAMRVVTALSETGAYAPMHQAMRTYSSIDTSGKAELTANAAGIIETLEQLLQGDYFSVSIVKVPAQYHHAFNTLIGNHGNVFKLLDDHNALRKSITSMHDDNGAWEAKCGDALTQAEKALEGLHKDEVWLVDELRNGWLMNKERVQEAQQLEKEARFTRSSKQEYYLAESTTQFREAYDKAVLATDAMTGMSQQLNMIVEKKKEQCYNDTGVTNALGIRLEAIAEEHCERGDKASKGRAVKHYDKGIVQKALLSSEAPIEDIEALLLRAEQAANGDKGKLAQIALLRKELNLAKGLDASSALPLLTSIADRAIALTEESPDPDPPVAREENPAQEGGVEEPEEEGREWDTSAAEQKLNSVKKALNTVVDLNFTVATVMDEEDYFKFKERLDALKKNPEPEEHARATAKLQALEKEMSNSVVGAMQRAKQEYETATVVMENAKVFDYAFLLEKGRQEYEKEYYNRAFIYAAYAKSMTVMEKKPITGLIGMELAPVLLGLAGIAVVVWKVREQKKEVPMRKVLKRIRAREKRAGS